MCESQVIYNEMRAEEPLFDDNSQDNLTILGFNFQGESNL